MQIGINILYLIPGKVGGTETYARELVPALGKQLGRDDQLIIFCGKESRDLFKESKKLKIIVLPIFSANRLVRILAEQVLLPVYCLVYKLDIIFSLGYSAPFIHRCPSVVTIHDLNWYYHPEDFGGTSRFIWEYLTRFSAATANHVITDSHPSAESIMQVLHIPSSKVTTILHGTPTTIKVKPKVSKNPYLFTVLANYPHKNLSTLLKAFTKLRKSFKTLELVVCGLGNQPSSGEGVHYLGYVTQEELVAIYLGASVFVFPSRYEGFGYPPLEAMSYGIPVVSSNAFSLKEVVGNGGILVSPNAVDEYVQSITKLLEDSKFRQQVVNRGKIRIMELNWVHTADRTLKLLHGYNQSL